MKNRYLKQKFIKIILKSQKTNYFCSHGIHSIFLEKNLLVKKNSKKEEKEYDIAKRKQNLSELYVILPKFLKSCFLDRLTDKSANFWTEHPI